MLNLYAAHQFPQIYKYLCGNQYRTQPGTAEALGACVCVCECVCVRRCARKRALESEYV
jgi:hypothetical protein